jgi:hypothetical protein
MIQEQFARSCIACAGNVGSSSLLMGRLAGIKQEMFALQVKAGSPVHLPLHGF